MLRCLSLVARMAIVQSIRKIPHTTTTVDPTYIASTAPILAQYHPISPGRPLAVPLFFSGLYKRPTMTTIAQLEMLLSTLPSDVVGHIHGYAKHPVAEIFKEAQSSGKILLTHPTPVSYTHLTLPTKA